MWTSGRGKGKGELCGGHPYFEFWFIFLYIFMNRSTNLFFAELSETKSTSVCGSGSRDDLNELLDDDGLPVVSEGQTQLHLPSSWCFAPK